MSQQNLERVNIITGKGTPGEILAQMTLEDLLHLGYAAIVAAAGGTDHNRSSRHKRIKASGIFDLASPQSRNHQSYGFLGDWARALAARKDWIEALRYSIDTHIRAIRTYDIKSPLCVYYYGLSGGHKPLVEEELPLLHEKLSAETRLACVIIPKELDQYQNVARDPWFPVRLWEEGHVATTVLVDNNSPLAAALGRKKQDEFVTQALAGFLAAIWSPVGAGSRSLADVATKLNFRPFLGLAFGSDALIPSKETPAWYSAYRQSSGAPMRGVVAHPDDIQTSLENCTSKAVTDPNWRTAAEGPDSDLPAFALARIPLPAARQDDLPLWREVIARYAAWLSATYPFITPLYLPAPGVKVGGEPYVATVSLCYPIASEEPQAIQRILDHPTVAAARRPLLHIEDDFDPDDDDPPFTPRVRVALSRRRVRRTHSYRLLKGATK